MTSSEELFGAIESARFAALVNVASNLKTFLRALDAQPEVQQLAAAMAPSEVRAAVLARVIELTGQEFDKEYENPWDSALAAYLWVLSRTDPQAAAVAAARVGACPRCWWANKVVEKVLAAAVRPLNGATAGSDTGAVAPTKTG